jgi:hypothetical protein
MGDNYLRVTPTVPDWSPGDAQAAAALQVMQALCPDGHAEIRRYDEVTFIDQGGNFEQVRCPRSPRRCRWRGGARPWTTHTGTALSTWPR